MRSRTYFLSGAFCSFATVSGGKRWRIFVRDGIDIGMDFTPAGLPIDRYLSVYRSVTGMTYFTFLFCYVFSRFSLS